jgi:hypothetical protein
MRIPELVLCIICVICIIGSLFLCFKTMKRDSWVIRCYVAGALLILIQCILLFGYLANTQMESLNTASVIIKYIGAGMGFFSVSLRISKFLPNGPFTLGILSCHYPIFFAGLMNIVLIIGILLRYSSIEKIIGTFIGNLTIMASIVIMALTDILYALYLCRLVFRCRTDKNYDYQTLLNQIILLLIFKLSLLIIAVYFLYIDWRLTTDSLTGIFFSTDGLFLYVFRKLTIHRGTQERLVDTNMN